jgi:hypothetical protein
MWQLTLNKEKEMVSLAEFEFLKTATMKDTVFWNMLPCDVTALRRRFGGVY